MISIIIPAKNEQENIADTVNGILKAMEDHRLDCEVIVIDDGSTDGTVNVVHQIIRDNDRIRLIKNPFPPGIGNAIRKGLEEFRGDYVIIAMADASDDPKDMVRYVREVQKGRDCCFGSRWRKGTVVAGYPKIKFILNRLVNWGINILFRLGYSDVTNAFKCYSRETIKGVSPILSRHFNITVELPLKAIVRGYSYTVIPTNWYKRRKGKKHFRLKEMGSRYLFIILYIFLEKVLCKGDYKKQ